MRTSKKFLYFPAGDIRSMSYHGTTSVALIRDHSMGSETLIQLTLLMRFKVVISRAKGLEIVKTFTVKWLQPETFVAFVTVNSISSKS